MKKTELEAWLTAVARGERPVAEAMAALSGIPTASLGFADVDQARSVRCGFPEVVFGAGKTPPQVKDIATEIVRAHGRLLATRLEPEALALLAEAFPDGDPHADAALFRLDRSPAPPIGAVSVLSAGTSDQRVAEEAVHTAEAMGAAVTRVYDVGVAGVHRLFDRRADFAEANALVVVAGMEGALPSIVGGLVDRPVIAVPTSVGYGASLGGLTALFGMLTSCASGVTVVNIDNGFGAGYAAATINRLVSEDRR